MKIASFVVACSLLAPFAHAQNQWEYLDGISHELDAEIAQADNFIAHGTYNSNNPDAVNLWGKMQENTNTLLQNGRNRTTDPRYVLNLSTPMITVQPATTIPATTLVPSTPTAPYQNPRSLNVNAKPQYIDKPDDTTSKPVYSGPSQRPATGSEPTETIPMSRIDSATNTNKAETTNNQQPKGHAGTVTDLTHDSSAKRQHLAEVANDAAQHQEDERQAHAKRFAAVEMKQPTEIQQPVVFVYENTVDTEARTAIVDNQQAIGANHQAIENNRARINDLYNQQENDRKEARAGSAAALAASSVPEVRADQHFFIGAGAGNYSGESAIAIGASVNAGISKVKFTVGDDTAQNLSVGVGAGIGW